MSRAGEPAPVRLRTKSAEDTRALGAAMARGLHAGDMVLLGGGLGAGKTTLAQGIAAGLGVTDHVTSPTFTLVRSYPCPAPAPPVDGQGQRSTPAIATFLHADLYRLDRLGEVADLAIGELVEDDAVAVVEWGDMAEPVLGRDALCMRIVPDTDDDHRQVTLVVNGSWATRRHELIGLLCEWAWP